MFRRLTNAAPELVEIDLDGSQVSVPKGISVAAALYYLDALPARYSPISSAPRAPYCMMGSCFDCLMTIDNQSNQQACQVIVRTGMQVRRSMAASEVEGQ